MKSEVYRWRISSQLKSDLKRAARLRGVPVSIIIETAAREWLRKNAPAEPPKLDDDAVEQRRLHSVVEAVLDSIHGKSPKASPMVRKTVRKRLGHA